MISGGERLPKQNFRQRVKMYNKRLFGILISLLLLVFLFPITIFAETIILKSGQKIEGKIIEKTNDYIKIDFYGVSLTYFLDEIESIDGIKLTKSLKKSERQSHTSSDKIYTDDNYGFSLIIPDGWFIVSGEQKRQAAKEKMDKDTSYENIAEKMQKEPGNKTCSLAQNPEALKKILDPLKKSVLGMLPVVTFYKFNPDSTPKDLINPSIQIMISDADKEDTLENMKFDYAMLKRFMPDIQFIEEAHDVVIDGASGVRAVHQDSKGRVSFDTHLVKNNKKYEIYFITDSQSFKEYMPYFEKALSSFEVEDKKEMERQN